MNLEWMAWTPVTAVFFIVIVLMLMGMMVWQYLVPTVERRGFLPMATTRGDRLFIGLLGSAYIHLGWIGFTELSLWIALGISLCYMVLLMRFG